MLICFHLIKKINDWFFVVVIFVIIMKFGKVNMTLEYNHSIQWSCSWNHWVYITLFIFQLYFFSCCYFFFPRVLLHWTTLGNNLLLMGMWNLLLRWIMVWLIDNRWGAEQAQATVVATLAMGLVLFPTASPPPLRLIFDHRLLLHHIRWFRSLQIPHLSTGFRLTGTTMAGFQEDLLGLMGCRWMSTGTLTAGVIMGTVHITTTLGAIRIQEI